MIQDNLTLPEYMRSTDFKTYEGLMKIMFGALKKDIDYIPELKDYENCPEHMLPILAYSIGCPYFSNTTVYVNRLILKNWWWMMKNKGTLPAIEMASSLALLAYNKVKNISDIDIFARSIDVLIDETNGLVYIRCLYQSPEDTEESGMTQHDWIMEMLPYVLPAGFKVTALPSDFSKIFLEAKTEHVVRIVRFAYSPLNQSGVGLKILEDNTTSFKDIYSTLENANMLTPNGVICPNGLIFGQFDPNQTYTENNEEKTCSECAYANECNAFTVLGIGQQELSAISSYGSTKKYPESHIITEKDDYIIERAENIYTTFLQNTEIDGDIYSDFLIDSSYNISYNNVSNWYRGTGNLSYTSSFDMRGRSSSFNSNNWGGLHIGNTYHVNGEGTLTVNNSEYPIIIDTDILLGNRAEIPFTGGRRNITKITINMIGSLKGLSVDYSDVTEQHYLNLTLNFYTVYEKPTYIYTFSLNNYWRPDYYNGLSFEIIKDSDDYIIRIPRSSTYFNNITFNTNDEVIFSTTPRNFK